MEDGGNLKEYVRPYSITRWYLIGIFMFFLDVMCIGMFAGTEEFTPWLAAMTCTIGSLGTLFYGMKLDRDEQKKWKEDNESNKEEV